MPLALMQEVEAGAARPGEGQSDGLRLGYLANAVLTTDAAVKAMR